MAGRGGLGWKPAPSLTPGPSRPVSLSVTWGWHPAPERLEDGGGEPRHLPSPPQVQACLSHPPSDPGCDPLPAPAPRPRALTGVKREPRGSNWGFTRPRAPSASYFPPKLGCILSVWKAPTSQGLGGGSAVGGETVKRGAGTLAPQANSMGPPQKRVPSAELRGWGGGGLPTAGSSY